MGSDAVAEGRQVTRVCRKQTTFEKKISVFGALNRCLIQTIDSVMHKKNGTQETFCACTGKDGQGNEAGVIAKTFAKTSI
jgi:hypothetical protein